MKLNNLTSSAIAVALAVALGSGVATAQATTRTKVTKDRTSTTRTPMRVTKENTSTGEVTPPAPTVNQDSINQARYQDSVAAAERMRQDSIARAEQMRRDSIAMAERMRADSIARADSISRANALAMRLRQIGGAYFGIDGGSAVPTGSFNTAHDPGFHGDAMFGVDPIGSPLGFRLSGGYSYLTSSSTYFNNLGSPATSSVRPQIVSLAGDVKLRLPVSQRYMSRFNLYGVGGVANYWYKDLTLVDDNNQLIQRYGNFNSQFGWNAGGGMTFGWNKTNLFVEARYNSFAVGGAHATHVPIVLGFTWF